MKITMRSMNSDTKAELDLGEDIFGQRYRPDILKIVVEWQLAKRRAGTHSTKTISEVSGTTAKPYRQKGTGRARQGSLRSVQFRGGGISFGPKTRSHAYAVNKKVRKLALKVALSEKLRKDKLVILDKIEVGEVKTKAFLGQMSDFSAKSILIIDHILSDGLKKVTSNLYNMNVLPVIGVNVYDLLKHDLCIITKDGLEGLERRLS